MPEETEAALANLNPKDYWVIQTASVEGTYIVTKLIRENFPKPNPVTHDLVLLAFEDGQAPAYWLRKAMLPIEKLAQATGLTVDRLATDKVITFKIKDRPDLPKPTVAGWGEA